MEQHNISFFEIICAITTLSIVLACVLYKLFQHSIKTLGNKIDEGHKDRLVYGKKILLRYRRLIIGTGIISVAFLIFGKPGLFLGPIPSMITFILLLGETKKLMNKISPIKY